MAAFSSAEFAEFNALLASAVERSLPLEPALALLASQAGSGRVRSALEALQGGLRDGKPLPAALREVPLFPADYVALVEAGHQAGRLAEVLAGTASFHSMRARLRARLDRILLYLGVGAFAASLLFVGAAFFAQRIRSAMDSSWAAYAREFDERVPLDPYAIVKWGIPALLIGGSAGWLFFRAISRFQAGYWLPFWGGFLRSRDLSLFCSVAGLRLSAGSSLPEALRSARAVVPNFHARRRIGELIRKVEEGAPISDALFYVRWFPRVLAWDVSLGERRGEVPRAFSSCAEIYHRQVERGFEMLNVALGPLGIVVLGNIAFFAALAAMSPFLSILRMTQTIY